MNTALVFQHLAIALGLGILVGLEREWVTSPLAGIRTFPMITIFGAISAILSQQLGGWVIASSVIALAGFVVVGNVAKLQSGEVDPGMTTEMAMLLMFAVGAMVGLGFTGIGVTVGGVVAVLLHWKRPMHDFVKRMGESDLQAVIRMVLIALVILPVLPNQTYGPYQVLNPFRIWLTVVLIVGISLVAYVAYRLLGAKAGTVLAGVFGGLISSTATTVSFARQSRGSPSLTGMAAVVIVIASAIVFIRVIFEIWVVAPGIFWETAPPLMAMLLFMATIAIGVYLFSRADTTPPPVHEAPSELRAAVVFGLLYAVVLLAVAAAQEHFGQAGLYVVAGVSGLTDMDALTLSTAQLVNNQQMDSDTGWRLIIVAGMSNIVFKGAVVGVMGNPKVFARVAVGFAMALASGALLLAFWP